MKLSAAQREAAIGAACRAWTSGPAIEFRAGAGEDAGALSKTHADELLAAAVARDRVELVLDVLAYEQGKRDASGAVIKNRNGVRFRAGAMVALGNSGKDTPFLAGHDRSPAAVGGRVVKSRTMKVDDAGHYQIWQTVLLTEPTFVERALRGLMQNVSIGIFRTGPTICTACGTEVMTKCWHWPHDKVLDAKGVEVEVEWEHTAAELVETSEAPVPAVPSAGIEGIRAAMSAQLTERGVQPQRTPMTKMQLLALKLGLLATATDEEVLAAAAARVDTSDEAIEELKLLKLEAQIDASGAVDKFIASAIAEGRIKPGADEAPWRALFEAAPERARSNMAKRAPQSATPAGTALQSGGPDPSPPPESLAAPSPATARDAKARATLTAAGRDYDRTLRFARAFGAKNPTAAIAKHGAGLTEEI